MVNLAFLIKASGSFFLSTEISAPSHNLLINGNSLKACPLNILPASSDINPIARHSPQRYSFNAAGVASLNINRYLVGFTGMVNISSFSSFSAFTDLPSRRMLASILFFSELYISISRLYVKKSFLYISKYSFSS